jgi:hypothetical protein
MNSAEGLWRRSSASRPGGAAARRIELNHPGDDAERAADRTAERATTAPPPPSATRVSGLSSATSARAAASSLAGALGPGAALRPDLAASLGLQLGADLSGVQVHLGASDQLLARSLGADAFSTGSHLVFAAGRYALETGPGLRLLAHELAHVVHPAAAARPELVHRKASAVRFSDEPTLDDVSKGRKVLKEGDTGDAVIRVTTALYDLGYYPLTAIDEHFDPPLTSAVIGFQTTVGLSGKVAPGVVEQQTFTKLDQKFAGGFAVERGVLGAQKSAGIAAQTQPLDPAERAASAKAISTAVPVSPVTGLPPAFIDTIPAKGKYADRLRGVVESAIEAEYDAMGKGKATAHADPAELYSWGTVDAIAAKSQSYVDTTFKEYLTGRPAVTLKHGVNISDAWSDKVAQLTAGGVAAEDAAAQWRVTKILDMHATVKALDLEHNAIHSRSAEKAIVDAVRTEMVSKHRAKLIETHKGWPGYEDADRIFIQRFKGATRSSQLWERWYLFQTFIHEYLHALESPAHRAYRATLAADAGAGVLREGTTDYFTQLVWSGIVLDEPLRKAVEGPVHDKARPYAVPPLDTYPEAVNAEHLVGVVGIRNLAAAFFLGRVDLIGKP